MFEPSYRHSNDLQRIILRECWQDSKKTYDRIALDYDYIERVPHETRCDREIVHPGAFIRIKAPRQMGKSSLMYRILDRDRQQNYHTTLIHFQQAESDILHTIGRSLCNCSIALAKVQFDRGYS